MSNDYVVNDVLFKRSMWLNKNIDFLFGTPITEYDMKSAGLSLIKEFKLLDEERITELDKMDKKAKNVKIGLLQKEKEFAKKLLECFTEARKRFIVSNELSEANVLSVKKDAIFVIETKPKNLIFGEIKFEPKNTYTSYIRLNKLEFYINTLTNVNDIKGLGQGDSLDEVHKLHDNGILGFMMSFTKMRENYADKSVMCAYLVRFIKEYRNRTLPIDYYRELGRGNSFKLYDKELGEYINVKDTDLVEDVEIGYNYFNYILPLASMYF